MNTNGISRDQKSLLPCDNKRHCVCSVDQREKYAISPLKATYPQKDFDRLKTLLKNKRQVKIVTETEVYIHAEFTSMVLRFIDDVEFLLNKSSKVIHVRSESRQGYYDFEANRKRIEAIRNELEIK